MTGEYINSEGTIPELIALQGGICAVNPEAVTLDGTPLTERQLLHLALVALGTNVPTASVITVTSESTTRTHRQTLYEKMGVNGQKLNRPPAATTSAFSMGILTTLKPPSIEPCDWSPEELEIIRYIRSGMGAVTIARRRFYTVRMTNDHIRRITKRLNIKGAAGIALYSCMTDPPERDEAWAKVEEPSTLYPA